MQEPAPWYLIPAILVGFPIVFGSIWSGVCALISMISGWRSMATRYAAPASARGAYLPSGFAVRVGLASYRGTVSFESTPEGLIARMMWLFPFHPTLLFPWRALTLTRGGGLFTAGHMKVEGGADFALNADAYQSIERALGGATQHPLARV